VDGPDGERPFRISAVCLPYGDFGYESALARVDAGLRIVGRRDELVVRRASLSAGDASALLSAMGVDEGQFSASEVFTWGDRIRIRSMVEGPPQVGVILHLVPWLRADEKIILELSAVARPPDGSLLPVLRAEVPVSGPGSTLLTGEANGERAFAALLRLDVPGLPPGDSAGPADPRAHDLRLSSFSLASDDLAAALRELGLPERGGLGGFAVHRVRERDLARAVAALARSGRTEAPLSRTLRSPGQVVLPTGTLRLELRTEFSVRDYTYRTRIRVTNREAARPQWTRHGEREGLLFVSWNAGGPRESRAVLVRIKPVD
jgi:hypothetical protein